MKEIKKHAFTLTILAVLLFLKFIVIPIYDWQDQLLVNIHNQEKKLAKINQVLADKDKVYGANQFISKEILNVERLFFPNQQEPTFKLNQQQLFEKLLEKYQLSSTNIGWQTKTEFTEVGVTQYQVTIRFNGQFSNIVAMLVDLESSLPWLELNNFNISTTSIGNGFVGYIQGARMMVNLYMSNTPNSTINAKT